MMNKSGPSVRVEKPELMMQVSDAHGYFLAASTGVDNCLLKVYVQKSLLRNVQKKCVHTATLKDKCHKVQRNSTPNSQKMGNKSIAHHR